MEVNSGGQLNIEVNFGGKFHYGGKFFLSRGDFVSHIEAKPVILYRCSSTRGDLPKSI
jgi:hypothetical protein